MKSEKNMHMFKGRYKLFLILLLLFSLLPGALSCQPIRSGHVEAWLSADQESVRPGQALTVSLHLRMDQGWYVYGREPGDVRERDVV